MRGRELFSVIRPLLRVCIAVLHCLPRPVCHVLFVLTRHVPTKFGIAVRYPFVVRLSRRCGECVSIHEGVYLLHLENAEFGDHISIHPLCYMDAYGGLRIGNHVSIAHNTSILTTEHDFTLAGVTTRDAPAHTSPVHLGENVWIGCGARILAGTTVGCGAVIGAGAVVTHEIPASTVAVGVPARAVKTIARHAA